MTEEDAIGFGAPGSDDARDKSFLQVGRIVRGAASLEATLREIATALALTPGNQQVREVASQARRRVVADGLPPWARTTPEEVTRWIDQARTPFNERDMLVHGRGGVRVAGDPTSYTQHLRTGKLVEFDIPRLARLGDTFAGLVASGTEVQTDLLPEVSPGVYVMVFGPPDGVAAVVTPLPDGSWPARPEKADLDACWDDLVRRYPTGWPPPAPPAELGGLRQLLQRLARRPQ